MKKSILLSLLFLFSFTLMAQPKAPNNKEPETVKTKTVKQKPIITDNYVAFGVNYGFAETLDFNLINVKKKAILGVGYSAYIGSKADGLDLSGGSYTYLNSFKTKDKAYSLFVGRQFSRLAVALKLGIKTDAVYNNYVSLDGGNPNNVYQSKVDIEPEFLYGGSLNYLLNQTTAVTVAYDNFNEYLVGVSTKLW